MNKNLVVSAGLIFVALVFGLVSIFAPFGLDLRIIGLLLGGFSSLASAVLFFGTVLNKTMRYSKSKAEVLADQLEDDIEALKQGTVTSTHIMCALSVVAAAVYGALVIHYGKLFTSWGPVPVIIPTILAVGLVVWIITKLEWFRWDHYQTPFWVYLIPAIAMVLALGLGIYLTEPQEYGGTVRIDSTDSYTPGIAGRTRASGYEYEDTRFYYWWSGFNWGSGSQSRSGGSSGGDFDIDLGDDAGEGIAMLLLILLLVVVAIILIVGSAFIPHFWLLAGAVFVALMFVITFRELRRTPHKTYTGRSSW